MRSPARLLPLLAATLAAACSGNDPQPPAVIQAGWSWSPAIAGTRPLPVTWTSGGAPQQLPLLQPAGDCGASGSVQAAANADGVPLFAGISASCSAGVTTMRPVVWRGGEVLALPLPAPFTQGSALAVAWSLGSAYVAGATGDAYPMPSIWKDGVLRTTNPGALLPAWSDSGVITSLTVTSKYAIAAGVIHVTAGPGTTAPVFQGVLWVLDPDFTSLQAGLLEPPASMQPGTFGGMVTTTFDGLQIYSAAAVSLDGQEKPVLWVDDVPFAAFGESFTTGPWAVPTGIALVDATPYVSGFVRSSGPGTTPVPGLWTPDASQALPTAGGAGSGEGVVIHTMWAFVTGESLGPDPSDPSRAVCLPALWTNGDRLDLPGLAAPGGGPAVPTPLPGWWKVPGTSPAQDWPWPGGFGEVLRQAPVSAAGSAVARAIVTIP